MQKATLNQAHQFLNLIAQSGINKAQLQVLEESGRFSELLREFMEVEDHPEPKPAHPEPTITPIKVPLDYGRTLVEMRDATNCDGYIAEKVNDQNFPVEAGESGERELVLVCFHCEIDDDEDPAKSELLRELDKLGLKPEGPPELLAVCEHHPDLQREFLIAARRQTWRNPNGYLLCPFLNEGVHERYLNLCEVRGSWSAYDRFLASRK